MTTKTIAICDRCSKPTDTDNQFTCFASRHADAAGSMENDYYHFHLCPKCMNVALKGLLKDFSSSDSNNFLRNYKIEAVTI